MAEQETITVYEIAVDGYPDMDDPALVGCVAFLWDGYVVTGWPLRVDNDDRSSPYTGRWEAGDDKLASVREFGSVTHWIRFPRPMWEYERRRGET